MEKHIGGWGGRANLKCLFGSQHTSYRILIKMENKYRLFGENVKTHIINSEQKKNITFDHNSYSNTHIKYTVYII